METENTELTGKIEFYQTEKGYGFIKSEVNNISYFFHHSQCMYSFIMPGDIVTFQLKESKKRPDSFEAVNIMQVFKK